MPIVNKPDINYGIWADGGNIEIPSSEKVEEGWVIEKPLNEHMNWLQNRSDKMLQYINQRGIPEWDLRTEYPKNAFTVRSGNIYQAMSQNIDKDPTANTAIWEQTYVKNVDFTDYSATVDKIKNNDGFLSFYVRKAAPVLDAAAKGVAYFNKTVNSGLAFVGNKPVIKNDNNIVAEFSGGTNPKDVVLHEQLSISSQTYQVGDIYITTADGDPKVRLGYGTWQRFGKGKTLVGFTDETSNSIPNWVKVAGSEYGEYDHKLSVDELPKHSHDLLIEEYRHGKDGSNANAARLSDGDVSSTGRRLPSNYNTVIGKTGGDQPHNNVQPSIVIFMWKRVS